MNGWSLSRLFLLLTAISVFTASAVPAQQTGAVDILGNEKHWNVEFNEICSFVDNAMDRNPAELETILFRCRLLEPRIEQLPEAPKKVFSRKLRMCRDFYQFVLEQKTGSAPETGKDRNAGGRK